MPYLTAISASQAPAVLLVEFAAREQRIAVYSPIIRRCDGTAELPFARSAFRARQTLLQKGHISRRPRTRFDC